jgi:hypothetical protein
MSFAIFKGESSVKDLVSRLFGGSEQTPPAHAEQAASALLQANPQLHDIGSVPAGTVINVPANAPPLKPGQEAAPALSRRSAVAAQVQQSLDRVAQRVADINARAATSANTVLTLVQSSQAQSVAHKLSTMNAQLPDLITPAQAAVTATKQNQAASTQPIAAVRASLQAFAQSKS